MRFISRKIVLWCVLLLIIAFIITSIFSVLTDEGVRLRDICVIPTDSTESTKYGGTIEFKRGWAPRTPKSVLSGISSFRYTSDKDGKVGVEDIISRGSYDPPEWHVNWRIALVTYLNDLGAVCEIFLLVYLIRKKKI